jgi:hypothetical protein
VSHVFVEKCKSCTFKSTRYLQVHSLVISKSFTPLVAEGFAYHTLLFHSEPRRASRIYPTAPEVDFANRIALSKSVGQRCPMETHRGSNRTTKPQLSRRSSSHTIRRLLGPVTCRTASTPPRLRMSCIGRMIVKHMDLP